MEVTLVSGKADNYRFAETKDSTVDTLNIVTVVATIP